MNGNQNTALVQQKNTVSSLLNSDRARLELAKVVPKHLTPERMTRVAMTACLKTPALFNCTPESLLQAVMLCGQAGLEPDGRLAHLIPFGNSVQVIFDYKGLVALMRRNGAELVYADKICEHDEFEAWVEDGKKKLRHKVDWRKARGNPYAYYAVVVQNGVFDYEVMTLEEVEDIRKRSKAANSGPWVTDFDEQGKKTVIRRMSKRYDLMPEIRDVINADDDTPAFNLPVVSAPVFSTPAKAALTSAPENEEPGEPASTSTPASPAPAPATDVSPVKKLRELCREAKLKESQVIEFLINLGSVEVTMTSFEEVALQNPATIKMVVDQFPDLSQRIKAEAA